MENRLYITIDTEMDANPHWEKPYPPAFTSVTEGIPRYLRPIWDKYDAHPIYFVSYEVLQDEAACRILREEAEKGAIIGAHLHPEYVLDEEQIKSGKGSDQFPCYSCSREEEKAKLEVLTNKITEVTGVRPVWYRAARFGADLETIGILKELGYQYDCSVTPDIDWTSKGGPDHSKGPHHSYYISDSDYYSSAKNEKGMKEIPVTIEGKRWGVLGKILPENWLFYKWLRPTHMFVYEQKSLIRKYKKNGWDMEMMFHSMEVMVNKSPYVRNRWMQKYYLYRLERTIRYAVKNGYCC